VVADQVLAATTELAARLGGVVNSRR
jgi:hypothetical protein